TVLYQKMGRYNEAVDEYTRIIKASPLDDEAYQNRGKCYQAMKKFDLALSDFNEAIELSPDLPSHYEARAKLYKVMNKVELYNKDSLMAQNLREKKP
ncbi:MAG TPA: tetratricopeptide repeat protein, partial [Candidatus Obscuribacter sp.]|nr:tetratricopeptide repeat protein [Candidatus Obscuribacter sp.]